MARAAVLLVLLWLPTTVVLRSAAPSYDGPLIDSHAHIDPYRSLVAGEGISYRVDARPTASQLTAAQYVASLDRNNIRCALAFHGIAFDGRQQELLDNVRRLLTLYPDRFRLLAEIFSSNPLTWFEATQVQAMLDAGLFRGFGEIQFANPPLGEDQTRAPVVFPDDPRFLRIYDTLGARRMIVMAHPASREGVVTAIRQHPGVVWLTHGAELHSRWTRMNLLEAMLDNNPTLYYTVDFSESLPEFLNLTKVFSSTNGDAFVRDMNANFDAYLARMTATWKDVIERHPDRFLWGTDMALPVWHWDPQVLDMMARFSRAFIGTLQTATAERFAYRNAEALLGPCGATGVTPPAAPTGLTADISGNSVTLRWNAASDRWEFSPATNYTLQVGVASAAYNLFKAPIGNMTSISASGVAAGTYYWRVIASNSAGASPPSAEAQFTVGGGCVPPGTPGNLRVSSAGRRLTFEWDASVGTSTYVIEAGSGPGLANLYNAPIGGAPTLVADAPPGVYYVRVRARNACGTSGASNELAVTVS